MLVCICYMLYAIIKNINKDEQVVALPVSNKVIVIDAGHRSEKMEEQYQIVEFQKRI